MITLPLPSSFRPSDFLTGPLLIQADTASWFVSSVFRKAYHENVDENGFARLHSTILRRVMGKPSTRIIEALKIGRAIETVGYSAGLKSTGYKLTDRFLTGEYESRPIRDESLIDRLERERRRQKSKWQQIHHDLDEQQQCVTIVSDADRILENMPRRAQLCQRALVDNIRRRDFHFSVSSTGRCFNSISGLKSDLRATLRIDGERVGCIDIDCAQPALLAMLLSQKPPECEGIGSTRYIHTRFAAPSPVPPAGGEDLECFRSLACRGVLYDVLGYRWELSRRKVKKRVLVDVLAKGKEYPSEVEKRFRQDFPSVYRAIRTINRGDHSTLIRHLQRMESWLVIENVAPRLLGRCPFVTLHDGIYSGVAELPAVEAAFHDTFQELGFSMSLKREIEGKKTKVTPK